ncbi:sugar ABC transporter permease, partial [Bifidobacterium animalis subsp. lactis]
AAVALIIFVIALSVALTYQHFVLNRDLDGAWTEKKASKKRKKRQTAEEEALAVDMEGVK